MRPETVAALKDPDAANTRSPALQLLMEYFRCVCVCVLVDGVEMRCMCLLGGCVLAGSDTDYEPNIYVYRRAPTDPECRGRFKVIASCRNLEELALPAFISNYSTWFFCCCGGGGGRRLLFVCGHLSCLYPIAASTIPPPPPYSPTDGKPVLITQSGRLHQGPNYLEMDIRVHRFSYLAKKVR